MRLSFIAGLLISTTALLSPMGLHADTFEDADGGDENEPEVVRFGLTCLKNTTGRDINYKVKWGDGDWTSFTIPGTKNARHFHSWKYAEPGVATSPNLRIRFDSDMSNEDSWVERNLVRYKAVEEKCKWSKKYKFVWDHGSKRYIDLVEDD